MKLFHVPFIFLDEFNIRDKPIALSFYFQVKNVFDRIIIYTLISYRYTYIHLNRAT